MESTHWWGPHLHGFWIMPLVFMILMCLFVGFMARRARGWRCGVGRIGPGRHGWWEPGPISQGWPETPCQILDRRYASGEITKEQREKMRRDLGLGPSQPSSGDG